MFNLKRPLAASLSALALGFILPATSVEAQVGRSAITCTNTTSGTNWQIMVDYGRSTVDANPAQVSATEISWQDAKDSWNYKLDRTSGKLTVVFASSTGGGMLFHRCKLD